MSEADESSGLHRVKYINFKNENDEQTSEIFTSPTKEGSMSSSRERSWRLSLKLIILFAATVIFISVSYYLYFKLVHHETYENYETEKSSIDALSKGPATLENIDRVNITKTQEASDVSRNEKIEYQKGNYSHNVCKPVKNVTKVVLVASTNLTPDNEGCTDNATCYSLLQKIKEEFDGLKYNFVIGGEGELYVGLGFICLSNNSESALYIKLSTLSIYSHKICLRITEIMEQGILCGYVSKYFDVTYKRGEDDYALSYQNILTYCQIDPSYNKNRDLHFHDPYYNMNTLIHRDFKWTVCGNFSNTTEVRKSRVITLDSLPKRLCLPLKEVDKIQVDVIEADQFNCSSISSCIKIFEEQHEGLHFNFIIGLNYEVYVGLGFRCRADNTTGNVLRIKILEPPSLKYARTYKFTQILEEGIACGKILKDYTTEANCQKFNLVAEKYEDYSCEERYRSIEGNNSFLMRLVNKNSLNESDFNITSVRGIVPRDSRLKYCIRNKEKAFEIPPDYSDDYKDYAYYS